MVRIPDLCLWDPGLASRARDGGVLEIVVPAGTDWDSARSLIFYATTYRVKEASLNKEINKHFYASSVVICCWSLTTSHLGSRRTVVI